MRIIDHLKTVLQIFFLLLIAAMILSSLLSLSSCSISQKAKSSAYKKTDSTGFSFSQASGKMEVDSTNFKATKRSHQEGIKINFGDEDELDIGTEDPVLKANDLAGEQKTIATAKSKKAAIHSVNIAGKTITSDRPIKSIDITSSGETSVIDLSKIIKSDSGEISNIQKSKVLTESEIKNKTVERSGANVLIWLGLGIVVIIAAVISVRLGFFASSKNSYKSR